MSDASRPGPTPVVPANTAPDGAVDPDADRVEREARISTAFSPHSPINNAELLLGRLEQVRDTTGAITQPGLHVMIYGERGVGKTSLANTLAQWLSGVVVATVKVNCAQSDTFSDVIRRTTEALQFSVSRKVAGFGDDTEDVVVRLSESLPLNGRISPDHVATVFAQLPPYAVLLVDEFDRLPESASSAFADLVKALSDRGASTTMVLVGVAEDVNDLIGAHASVERCLRQVRLQRMSEKEIQAILDKGLQRAGYEISPSARGHIVRVAQGFPQYAHLLGQNAARAALDAGDPVVHESHVIAGMEVAVHHADQSHRDAYFKAATGTKKDNLWKEVVAACALAESDERGYFSSRAVQDSLSKILGRPVIQQTVAFHLGKLTEQSRGPLLERVGPERRYRYRFINPLMRPFMVMKATSDGMIAG